MPAQHPAGGIHNISRLLQLGTVLQQILLVVIRHKADFLALRLVGHRQAALCRLRPGIRLHPAPQGSHYMGQLLLPQAIKGISLILAAICTLADIVPARCLIIMHPGVVPCSKIIAAQLRRLLQKAAKLHIWIAGNTRIRSAPCGIFIQKIIYHLFLKQCPEIRHMMGNTQKIRHYPGILDGTGRAITQLHGDANHLMPLLLQKRCRQGAVHAAAHGNGNSSLFHIINSYLLRHSSRTIRCRHDEKLVQQILLYIILLLHTFVKKSCTSPYIVSSHQHYSVLPAQHSALNIGTILHTVILPYISRLRNNFTLKSPAVTINRT